MLRKRPINFAIECYNKHNLAALLKDPTVNTDVKYHGPLQLTPINFLVGKIDDSNFEQIFPCIELLVKHLANVNTPDGQEMTPILHIMKNKKLSSEHKRKIVQFIFDNAYDVDIDTSLNGEARKLLVKQLPDLILPSVRNKIKETWDFNRLLLCLKDGNQTEFLRGLNVKAEKKDASLLELFAAVDADGSLLTAAASNGMTKAVERMLRLGANINQTLQKDEQTLSPIECACEYGHLKVLELLLSSSKIITRGSVSIVVRRMNEEPNERLNYEKCFHLLLVHRNVDLDYVDNYYDPALHHAVQFNDQKTILALLDKGAYIGVKNTRNKYSISNINPKVFEEHLDNCVTTILDDDFVIQFDYSNLVPVSTKQYKKDPSKIAILCADEMAPIDYISKSNELRHLLKHPLMASFIFLKWHRLAFFFYLNLLVHCIMSGNLFLLIVSSYSCSPPDAESDSFDIYIELNMYLLLFMIVLTFVREVSQLIFSPRTYFKAFKNYLELALLFLVAWKWVHFVGISHLREDIARTIDTITVILLILELLILFGSLEIFDFPTYLVMLKAVGISFIKSFAFNMIILIGFGVCFFILMGQSRDGIDHCKLPNSTEASYDEQFNNFGNFTLSLMKTFVMSTGEFNLADIKFPSLFSALLFFAFIFLVPIVLMNLLNGLAVSDTQVQFHHSLKSFPSIYLQFLLK